LAKNVAAKEAVEQKSLGKDAPERGNAAFQLLSEKIKVYNHYFIFLYIFFVS
jgi:hypothetical protein